MKSSSNTLSKLIEEKIDSTEIYKGKSFSFHSDTIRLPDGRTAKKDYVKYPEAVAIIPFLDDDRIILVQQYRYPVGQLVYEIPAGKMDDPEETKLEAAHRELLEETGYRAKSFEFLFSYYPCVGYSTEIIHVFKAAQMQEEQQFLDEDEFINTKIVSWADALQMIRKGEINESKTILALLHYETFRKKHH